MSRVRVSSSAPRKTPGQTRSALTDAEGILWPAPRARARSAGRRVVEPADAPQPLFGAWVWWQHGSERSVEYLTGYLVERSLSVDNLFVFMLLLSAFAVPEVLMQRVLL